MHLSFSCYYSHSLGLVSARHGNMCLQISGQGQWRGRCISGAHWPASLRALERSRPVAGRSHKTKNDSQGCTPAPTDLLVPTPSHHLAAPPTYAPIHVHTCKNNLEKYKDNTHFNWKTQREKEMRMRGKKRKICLMYRHSTPSLTGLGSWEPNTGPRAYKVRILLTESYTKSLLKRKKLQPFSCSDVGINVI